MCGVVFCLLFYKPLLFADHVCASTGSIRKATLFSFSFVLSIRTCCLVFWVTQKLFYYWGIHAVWANPLRYWFHCMKALCLPFAAILEAAENCSTNASQGQSCGRGDLLQAVKEKFWEVVKMWHLTMWMPMYLLVKSHMYCGYRFILFIYRHTDAPIISGVRWELGE